MKIQPIQTNNFVQPKFGANYKPSKILKDIKPDYDALYRYSINRSKYEGPSFFNVVKMLSGIFAVTTFCSLFQPVKTLLEERNKLEYVEPLQNVYTDRKSAIDYAVTRITPYLNQKKPLEYSVIINDNECKIESEVIGDTASVKNIDFSVYYDAVSKDSKASYTILHGHPQDDNGATQSFSFADFSHLNSLDVYKTTIAIDKDGRFVKLTKKDNYVKLTDKQLKEIEDQYEKAFDASWPITFKYTDKDNQEKSFIAYYGIHYFWKSVAEKYNLEYSTNYGARGDFDAYEHQFDGNLY